MDKTRQKTRDFKIKQETEHKTDHQNKTRHQNHNSTPPQGTDPRCPQKQQNKPTKEQKKKTNPGRAEGARRRDDPKSQTKSTPEGRGRHWRHSGQGKQREARGKRESWGTGNRESRSTGNRESRGHGETQSTGGTGGHREGRIPQATGDEGRMLQAAGGEGESPLAAGGEGHTPLAAGGEG